MAKGGLHKLDPHFRKAIRADILLSHTQHGHIDRAATEAKFKAQKPAYAKLIREVVKG